MSERKNSYPRWIDKIKDNVLRNNVANIVQLTKTVGYKYYNQNRSDNDLLALDIVRENLRDKLVEISESGDYQKNPLWEGLMQIRPKIIEKRLNLVDGQNIVFGLWNIKEEADKSNELEKANFFRKLALQLNRKTLNFYTAIISGGVYEERGAKGKSKYHFFVGIPFQIGKEAGVKLTTKPENFPLIVKAYETTYDIAAEGAAKMAIKAQIEDMKEIFAKDFSFERKVI